MSDIDRRIKRMSGLKEERWAPVATAFFENHDREAPLAEDFFRALECFAFACEFDIIDSGTREDRFHLAAEQTKARSVPDPLTLAQSERMALIEQLHRKSSLLSALAPEGFSQAATSGMSAEMLEARHQALAHFVASDWRLLE